MYNLVRLLNDFSKIPDPSCQQQDRFLVYIKVSVASIKGSLFANKELELQKKHRAGWQKRGWALKKGCSNEMTVGAAGLPVSSDVDGYFYIKRMMYKQHWKQWNCLNTNQSIFAEQDRTLSIILLLFHILMKIILYSTSTDIPQVITLRLFKESIISPAGKSVWLSERIPRTLFYFIFFFFSGRVSLEA